jgi:gluconolactonase
MSLLRLLAAAVMIICCWLPGSPAPARAQESLFPAGARLEQLWNDGEFTEGVAAAPDGTIYFSDIPGTGLGRVLKFDPATGRTTVHCRDSGKSNGLMFDASGRLIAACGANEGLRALCEVTPQGEMKVLVGRFQGKPFNSPNDLVIHTDGSIYFSDPRYVGDEPVELEHQSVYRYDRASGELKRVTTDITKPNGVILSPDGKTLYVAETDGDTPRMTLNRFPVREDGTLGKKTVLVDFGSKLGIDGMTVDRQGNLYAALRSADRHGIVAYSPDGQERGFLPTQDLPTNCCFGRGEESKTLYVTSGKGLYRVRLTIAGYHLPQL